MLHHYGGNQNITSPAMASTFSLFFPLPKRQWPVEEAYDDHSSVTCPSSPSSSSAGSVDCTLSLGTPSSRRNEAKPGPAYRLPSGSAMSWDAMADSYYCQGKPTASAAKGVASLGPDPLLARRCANCGTPSTPLWRNGPRGPKSLCNACGIRYKKEERRAAATAENGGGGGCGHSGQRLQQWECYGSSSKAVPAVTSGEDTLAFGDSSEAPFLAWRLNVVPAAATSFSVWPAERPSLFQYN